MATPTVTLPSPGPRRVALRVSRAAAARLRRGHPWLHAREVIRESHAGAPGDLAVAYDPRDRFVAVGLYDPISPIRLRVLQHNEPAPIDATWFADRLTRAAERRASLPAEGTTGYRLVHGEHDGLPGLVIDRYGEVLVLKAYTPAWLPHLRPLLEALAHVVPAEGTLLRLSRRTAARSEALHGLFDTCPLAGRPPDEPTPYRENGLRLEADLRRGHKTGAYHDQRENRARVEGLAAGRRVLNAFAYTGLFGLYAARGGATAVLDVDVSAPALEAGQRLWALNQSHSAVAAARRETLADEAFAALERLARAGQRYDLVILDPPSFCRRAAHAPRALAAYRRLTCLALRLLPSGGILIQASCSRPVSPETFYAAVTSSAEAEGRSLRELARTGHPVDHPVAYPEGAYLKCLFAEVP